MGKIYFLNLGGEIVVFSMKIPQKIYYSMKISIKIGLRYSSKFKGLESLE